METEPPASEKILVQVTMAFFGRWVYRHFVQSLNLKGDEHVLDFGSGWGMNAKLIAERLNRGGRLTCLDVSSEWLDIAKRRLRRFTNVEFVHGDISRAGIPDKSYDLVVIHFVLHDVDSDAREQTVLEIARVLKDDGRLVIRDPLLKTHGLSIEEIRRVLTLAGLKEGKWATVNWPLFAPAYQGSWTKSAP